MNNIMWTDLSIWLCVTKQEEAFKLWNPLPMLELEYARYTRTSGLGHIILSPLGADTNSA